MFGKRKQRERELIDQVASLQQQINSIRNESVSLSDVERLGDLFQMRKSSSGIVVTPERAKTFSAVYRAVLLIASTIATMPMEVYRKTKQGRDVAIDHPYYRILHNAPTNSCTKTVFWESFLSDLPLTGDGIAPIVRNRGGDLLGFIYVSRNNVQILRQIAQPERLAYRITFDNGTQKVFDQSDVLHVPNHGFNGIHGRSTISYAADSIGIGLSADEYSGEFFQNDSTPTGHIEFDKKLTQDTADFLLKYWEERHQGRGNRHRTGIIPEGGKWVNTSLNAEDTQLIETRRFQIGDIARFFGVPLHLLQETDKSTSWGTGIEEQYKNFIALTLQPYISRLEEEINRKVFGDSSEYFAEINTAGLLRGDIKNRYAAYQVGLGGNQLPGFLTINEVRRRENLPPIEGGDTLYKPATGITK